jgi:hypothetical protein
MTDAVSGLGIAKAESAGTASDKGLIHCGLRGRSGQIVVGENHRYGNASPAPFHIVIGHEAENAGHVVNYPDLSWRFEVGACNCPVV